MVLIEREIAIEVLEHAAEHYSRIDDCTEHSIRQCISTIKKIPTIDPIRAAGGCRCGECRHRTWYAPGYGCGNPKAPWYRQDDDMPVLTKPNDFCSYGEPRKTQEIGKRGSHEC